MPRTAHADREIALGVSYDPRMPVGGLKTLAPGIAFAGVQGKWEYYAIPGRLAVGFDFQYHSFTERDTSVTVPIDNGAATAPFARYAYFVSMLPTARYFFLGRSSQAIRPFIELGVGATAAVSAVQATDLSRRSNTGGLIVQPTAGVLVPLGSGVIGSRSNGVPESVPSTMRPRESLFGLAASVAWAFTTADVILANNVNYVGIQLGIYAKL
jgi:hypothetical protein